MDFTKLRNVLVELKIYFTRTSGYLGIFNFLMIALIFLNTTLWEYGTIKLVFEDRKTFILVGFSVVILITLLIGYLDTKFKIWRTESERNLRPERNPFLIPMAFECAKILADLKAQGKDTLAAENQLDQLFGRCGMKQEFEMFKEATK